MPTIRSANDWDTVFHTQSGSTPSHHFRMQGLHITRHSTGGEVVALIRFGTDGSAQNTLAKVPEYFEVDRSIIRGIMGLHTRRGIDVSAKHVTITNSHFENFNSYSDTQAILVNNSPGEINITNNYLQATGENFMSGGVTVSVPNMTPTNIVFEHNYVHKPLSWRGNEPGTVKNLFELKHAKNVLVQHNIFENSWAHGQSGEGLVLTTRGEGVSNSWYTVSDVTIRYNIIKNVSNGVGILLSDDDGPSVATQNMLIEHNLLLITGEPLGGIGRTAYIGRGQGNSVSNNVVFNHNTVINTDNYYPRFYFDDSNNGVYLSNFKFDNNILAPTQTDYNGFYRSNSTGTNALNSAAGNSWTFDKNVIRQSASGYPNTSFYTNSFNAIGFENTNAGNYKLASNSPYKGQATNGTDPGVNWDVLMAATANVVS
ncbi:MAG TPA: hypothetical protein PKD79_04420, partial [Candidatus Doudnabacteria bacterium]|nr:hypothetical protein [Candidatus Doudnabacteria bacterium]